MVLLEGADTAEEADDDADDSDDDDEHGRVVDAAAEERQVVLERALQHCSADYEYYTNNLCIRAPLIIIIANKIPSGVERYHFDVNYSRYNYFLVC